MDDRNEIPHVSDSKSKGNFEASVCEGVGDFIQ